MTQTQYKLESLKIGTETTRPIGHTETNMFIV